MDMKFDADNVVSAIGSLGEMSGVLYKSLINNGFGKEEALFLVREFIIATLTNPQND